MQQSCFAGHACLDYLLKIAGDVIWDFCLSVLVTCSCDEDRDVDYQTD